MEKIPDGEVAAARSAASGDRDRHTLLLSTPDTPQSPPAKSHQATQELLTHLRSAVNACEDALVSVKLDGTIVLWNSGAESLFGYSAAEAIGRPISLLVTDGRPDEVASMLHEIRIVEHVQHFETVRVRGDGTPIDISLTSYPIMDSSGRVIGVSAIARDITGQKRMQRDMYRWQEQLRAIVRGVDDAVLVRGPEGRAVYANDNAAHLLGFESVDDLLANPLADTHKRFDFYTEAGNLIYPDRLPGMLALRGIEVPPTVTRFRSLLTGEERWAVVKAIPIPDEDGQVQYAASIFSDITEHKRAEEALKLSELRFQAFMDNSPVVAFIKDEQARFVYVNPRFESAFQTTAAAVIGISDTVVVPDEVARRIHADDAEVLSTGKLKEIIEVIPGPDGTHHHWLTFKFPMSLPGGQRYIAGASVEITDRVHAEEALKESETRFQAFMHNAPVVAYMKDESGKVVFLNHAWEQLFGIPIAEALGKDDFQLQPPDLAEQFRAADVEVLRTGQVKVLPETVTAVDGTVRHWMTFKFPIVLPSGARFVGGASVEITERVQAEQELQRYAERLRMLSRQLIEAQEAERRRISRDLHDQVGQSLTAIKIDLQVAQHELMAGDQEGTSGPAQTSLAGGEPPSSQATFAGRLGRSIEMVEHTIQQVREFSLDLRPSILDDLGLPSALLWYAEEQARRAGFRADVAIEQLAARLSPELEITCFRVAQEAITNVVRHARAGRVSVELRRSGEELMLTVSDDGIGFSPRALASETSVGAGREVREGDEGMEGSPAGGNNKGALSPDRIRALGLAGMQERVLLVGGRLSIQSRPGAGTTVRAVFPLNALH
jgi:PAS domain S-box-containing protein